MLYAPPPMKLPLIKDCCPDAWTNAPGTGGSGAVGQGLEEEKAGDGRPGASPAGWIAAIIQRVSGSAGQRVSGDGASAPLRLRVPALAVTGDSPVATLTG